MVDTREDWKLARDGIKLLLNNNIEEAEQLFVGQNDNIQMAAGYCFVTFMSALMTFEEDKLEDALQTLRDIEKRCARDVGWLKSMKNKVFGSYSLTDPDVAERLEEQIILADSQVCVAILTFLQQDLTSYVRGGWVLRKAWKVYQHAYSQILMLYKKAFGTDAVVPGSQFPTWNVVTRSVSSSSLQSPVSPSCDWSVPDAGPSSSLTPNGFRNPLSYLASFAFSSAPSEIAMKPEVIARLMAAVSFGYGIFQLCISLLPPSLLKLIHFLGFEGDRKIGIAALMFSREGNDMRGPLASLALLWYHTIVRPFFALDGSNVQAGVDTAETLIAESLPEFGESALFLFFQGRVERLKSNIPLALEAYEAAIEKSPQREIQLLCLHEVGWCYLIHQDWSNAYQCFNQLKNKSRWSKAFYTYLTIVCVGANGNVDYAAKLAEEMPSLEAAVSPGQTRTQIETFISRRTKRLPIRQDGEEVDEGRKEVEKQCCQLLALELLYLWNALPSCTPAHMDIILQDCSAGEGEPMVGMAELIAGAVHLCKADMTSAVEKFKLCLEKRRGIHCEAEGDPLENNDHISVFALFETAMILIQDPERLDEGKAMLIEAQNNYKGYDFENRLNIRIHAALRKLN